MGEAAEEAEGGAGGLEVAEEARHLVEAAEEEVEDGGRVHRGVVREGAEREQGRLPLHQRRLPLRYRLLQLQRLPSSSPSSFQPRTTLTLERTMAAAGSPRTR